MKNIMEIHWGVTCKMKRFLCRPSYRHDTCPDARSGCTHRAYGLKLHRLSTIERPVRARRPRDRSSQSFFAEQFPFWNAKILTKSLFLIKNERKSLYFWVITPTRKNAARCSNFFATCDGPGKPGIQMHLTWDDLQRKPEVIRPPYVGEKNKRFGYFNLQKGV